MNAVRVRKWERDFQQACSGARQQDLAESLTWLFGSVDVPRLPQMAADGSSEVLELGKITMSAGPVGSDQVGRPRGVYRKHCAYCHGVSGAGGGPTATFLNPYPRDFRLGIYKFKSTPKGHKPSHDDLHRILVNGIPGTAMPSYQAIPAEEIESLVHYVKYLSVRGEVERLLIDYAATELEEDEPLIDEDAGPEEQRAQQELVLGIAARLIRRWASAGSRVTHVPPADPRRDLALSKARGRELFLGEVTGCVKCHGRYGLGDGQTSDYDDWTKEIEPTSADALVAYRSVGALAPRRIRPRNLRQGIFRGGARPEDLFLRIRNGIDGTPMPEALIKLDSASENTTGLSHRDLWSLVDYVQGLASDRHNEPTGISPGS